MFFGDTYVFMTDKYIHIFEQHKDSYKIQNELLILKQAANSNVIWDEIINIEIYTPDQNIFVYDFTVPGNQTFMTDYGVIVHNTLNSVTYETEIIVRNREGIITKHQIGDFIENKIKVATKTEYYKDKDTEVKNLNVETLDDVIENYGSDFCIPSESFREDCTHIEIKKETINPTFNDKLF